MKKALHLLLIFSNSLFGQDFFAIDGSEEEAKEKDASLIEHLIGEEIEEESETDVIPQFSNPSELSWKSREAKKRNFLHKSDRVETRLQSYNRRRVAEMIREGKKKGMIEEKD